MYYGRSRSPAPYSTGLSYNSYSSDLTTRSFTPRNRSIQRVLDTDFVRPERSRSPIRDYSTRSSSMRTLPSVLSSDTSPVLRRRELDLTSQITSNSRGSPVNWLGSDDYSLGPKPKSYYEFTSTPSRLSSYTSPVIKMPRRIDYSDYLRPSFQSRPTLKAGYTPRPRSERDASAMPIVRERKLIKFREITNDILNKVRRKMSWDIPEEIQSPLINEMRNRESPLNEKTDTVRSRDSSLSRHESKEILPQESSLSRYSLTQSHSRDCSLTRYSSHRRDSYPDPGSPLMSRRSSDHYEDRMSPRNLMRLNTDYDATTKVIPPPRKKSVGSVPRVKKHRRSSIENTAAEERSVNYSIIADKIRRFRESSDTSQLPDNSSSSNFQDTLTDTLHIDEKSDKILPDINSAEIAPDHLPRRRRRISQDRENRDDSKTRRQRSRSELEDTCVSQETSPSPFLNVPHPINRMHRKSVKYKVDKSLQRNLSKESDDLNQLSTLPPAARRKHSLKNENVDSVDNSPQNYGLSERKLEDAGKEENTLSDAKNIRYSRTLSREKLSQSKDIEKKENKAIPALQKETNIDSKKSSSCQPVSKTPESLVNKVGKPSKKNDSAFKPEIEDHSLVTNLSEESKSKLNSKHLSNSSPETTKLNKLNINSLDIKSVNKTPSNPEIEKPKFVKANEKAENSNINVEKLTSVKIEKLEKSSLKSDVKQNCSSVAIKPDTPNKLLTDSKNLHKITNKEFETQKILSDESPKVSSDSISADKNKSLSKDIGKDASVSGKYNNSTLINNSVPDKSVTVAEKLTQKTASNDAVNSKYNSKIENISPDAVTGNKKSLPSNKANKVSSTSVVNKQIDSSGPAIPTASKELNESSNNNKLSNKINLNDARMLKTSKITSKDENVLLNTSTLSPSSKLLTEESTLDKMQIKSNSVAETSCKLSNIDILGDKINVAKELENHCAKVPSSSANTSIDKSSNRTVFTSNVEKQKAMKDQKLVDHQCEDSSIKILPVKETIKDDEIVVVCKLPQPKKSSPVTKPRFSTDTSKIIPVDQTVVVSIVNSKTVLVSEKEPDPKNATGPDVQLRIPNKQTLPASKKDVTSSGIDLGNKTQRNALHSTCKEGPEVSVVHTVVLKPKSQNMDSSEQSKSDSKTAVSAVRLKSIPDVIQSAVNKSAPQAKDSSTNVIVEKAPLLPSIKKEMGSAANSQHIPSSPKIQLPVNEVPDLMQNSEKTLECNHVSTKLGRKDVPVVEECLQEKRTISSTSKGKSFESSSTKPDLINVKIIPENKAQIENKVSSNILAKKEISKTKTSNSESIMHLNATKLHLNENDISKTNDVKQTTNTSATKSLISGTKKFYKKSVTVPDVNAILLENSSSLFKQNESSISGTSSKEKNVAHLSSSSVPATFLETEKAKIDSLLSDNRGKKTKITFKDENKDFKKPTDLNSKALNKNYLLNKIQQSEEKEHLEKDAVKLSKTSNISADLPNHSIVPDILAVKKSIDGESVLKLAVKKSSSGDAVSKPDVKKSGSGDAVSKPDVKKSGSGDAVSKPDVKKSGSGDAVSKLDVKESSSGDAVSKLDVKKSGSGDAVSKPVKKSSSGDAVSKLDVKKSSSGEAISKPDVKKSSSGDAVSKPVKKSISGDAVSKPDVKESGSGETISELSSSPDIIKHTKINLNKNEKSRRDFEIEAHQQNEKDCSKQTCLSNKSTPLQAPDICKTTEGGRITKNKKVSDSNANVNEIILNNLPESGAIKPTETQTGKVGVTAKNISSAVSNTLETDVNGNSMDTSLLSKQNQALADKSDNKIITYNESPKIAKSSNKATDNSASVPKVVIKTEPPKPPPVRYGLRLPPKTILESSSSSDESDSSDSECSSTSSLSSETETPKKPIKTAHPKSECSIACHQKCEKLMPNICGNQKLLSQALEPIDREDAAGEFFAEKCPTESENLNWSIKSSTSTSTLSVDGSPKDNISKMLKFREYGIDDFEFIKLLGKGSYGKVLLAELKGYGMYFAVKCLEKAEVIDDDDVESIIIERRVLALGTQHPYMCKLYCTFQTQSYLFFVMEYLNGGDLMYHIQKKRFDLERTIFYGAEIVSALKFLHKRGIIYRDIKLDNVLLDKEGHIRLVDFGMCQCRVYNEEAMPSNFCGTPSYMAPEIVLGQLYNQSVDWWSFGVLLFEMLVGNSPFTGFDEDELLWSVCNEEPSYPRTLPKKAKDILENLLLKSPSKRLGMPSSPAGEIKDHPFFSTIDWDKLERKEIPPPYKPRVTSDSDTRNFDKSFTRMPPTLEATEPEILSLIKQERFKGFNYTNPHMTR